MADSTRFRVRYRLLADSAQEADQRALGNFRQVTAAKCNAIAIVFKGIGPYVDAIGSDVKGTGKAPRQGLSYLAPRGA